MHRSKHHDPRSSAPKPGSANYGRDRRNVNPVHANLRIGLKWSDDYRGRAWAPPCGIAFHSTYSSLAFSPAVLRSPAVRLLRASKPMTRQQGRGQCPAHRTVESGHGGLRRKISRRRYKNGGGAKEVHQRRLRDQIADLWAGSRFGAGRHGGQHGHRRAGSERKNDNCRRQCRHSRKMVEGGDRESAPGELKKFRPGATKRGSRTTAACGGGLRSPPDVVPVALPGFTCTQNGAMTTCN